jgi:SAM-dependent methyltransferase
MTMLSPAGSSGRRVPTGLFPATVFISAALVFLVQPMVAKLVLPLLGGSPSVWNTSMAFFQIALLAGYAYAHGLQRLGSIRAQALIHGLALLVSALVLPLRIHELSGPPSTDHPVLWLLGALAVSIGAPFAVLSATAPLVQAWHARTVGAAEGREPYVLYAASNLGSVLALLAYPLAVEPLLAVHSQTMGWSLGYGAFVALISGLALFAMRAAPGAGQAAAPQIKVRPTPWRDRLVWVILAAIPSSLMLGVTTHITTDVASAPFLWVIPLTLYLVTFILAFEEKPRISPDLTLTLQAAAMVSCVALLPFKSTFFALQLVVHLLAFFLTALMCHQRLVARRPDPAHLTEFYLCLSIGGVVGGGFNAFLAPLIFNNVWEYPIVLALACLARPWSRWRPAPRTLAMLILGLSGALGALAITHLVGPRVLETPLVGGMSQVAAFELGLRVLIGTSVIAAFLLRGQTLLMFAVIVALSIAADRAADRTNVYSDWRSFFGVLRESETQMAGFDRPVRMLAHGTTLHGAQALDPQYRCRPLVYYTHAAPIGQVLLAAQASKPSLRIGAVGLGTGAVAAYSRPRDQMTFFEIDPLVIRIATDPQHFSYTTDCAKGVIDYRIGDARLTLAREPAGVFDVLLIDAFSSDSVPTHLLTTEAVRGYLTRLKPDGVLILHLSNRNLDLKGPAQALAHAIGASSLLQEYRPVLAMKGAWESSSDVLILAKSPQALSPFVDDPRWAPGNPHLARPWTDDYTNLPGALWRRMSQRWLN